LIVAEYDKEIISLAQQILGHPKSKSDPSPVQPKEQPPALEIKVEARQESAEVPTGAIPPRNSRNGYASNMTWPAVSEASFMPGRPCQEVRSR
jgi:hypothetical protein